jgi:hypothetical protein
VDNQIVQNVPEKTDNQTVQNTTENKEKSSELASKSKESVVKTPEKTDSNITKSKTGKSKLIFNLNKFIIDKFADGNPKLPLNPNNYITKFNGKK